MGKKSTKAPKGISLRMMKTSKAKKGDKDILYSMSGPGYEAWLADGHKGTFEDFLESQSLVSDKEWMIEKILAELLEMSLAELKKVFELIRDKKFTGT